MISHALVLAAGVAIGVAAVSRAGWATDIRAWLKRQTIDRVAGWFRRA